MKSLFTLFFFFSLSPFLFAQSWKADIKKADSLRLKGKVPEAQELLDRTLMQMDSGSYEYVKVRVAISKLLTTHKDKAYAEKFFIDNLKYFQHKPYVDSLFFKAEFEHILAMFYNINRNYPQAEKYFLSSNDVFQTIYGENHTEYLVKLNGLANVYSNTFKYKEAESLYKSIIIGLEKNKAQKHFNYSLGINGLGILYAQYSQYQNAEKYFLKFMALTKHTNSINYARALNNLAQVYKESGQYDKAESLFKESLELKKNTKDEKPDDYASSLLNLAALYNHKGQNQLAEKYFKEAYELLTEKKPDSHLLSSILNGLAYSDLDLGKFEAAEKSIDKSLRICEKTYGKMSPNYALALQALLQLYLDKQKSYKLKMLSNEIGSILEQTIGKNSQEYANHLGNSASWGTQLGNYFFAKQNAREAMAIYENINMEKTGFYYTNLSNLAFAEIAVGNYDEANTLLETSQDKLKALFSENSNYYLDNLSHLMLLDRKLNHKKKLNARFALVKRIMTQKLNSEFKYLSESEQENYYDNILNKASQTYLSLGLDAKEKKQNGEMFDFAMMTKAFILQASLKVKRNILNSKDSTLITAYNDFIAEKQIMMKYTEMSGEERAEKFIDLDSLEKNNMDKEKKLSLLSSNFAQATDKTIYTWLDLREKIDKDEAAIEIVRINKFGVQKIVTDTSDVEKAPNFPQYPIYDLTDTVYYAALIVKKKSKQPEIVLLKNGNDLEKKFLYYQKNAINYKREDAVSYNEFWKPIAEKLKGIKKVYFSPDGVYNQISLNTLQNPETKKYVLDEIELHLVTNTKDILAFGKAENKNLKAELLGYPIYDLQTENADESRKRELASDTTRAFNNFQKVNLLPGTKKEVEDISKILETKNYQLEALTEKNATEENIKKVHNPKILHLSTHGFFIDSKEKNDKVNPMLRSGLLLTGVSDYTRAEIKPETEDGILTALEAANLDLDETDLVVLSACETGLGDVKAGEGVYGLQRAFKVAGAKTIVMSMWKVDDEVTQKLMTTFYQKFAEYNNARKAFKEAQEEIKKQYPEPYYWGAFVMTGE